MKEDINSSALNYPDSGAARMSRLETHEDLIEFNATKKTVTELLNYKRSLIEVSKEDVEKIREIKSRAIAAINHLFNDIINSKKS